MPFQQQQIINYYSLVGKTPRKIPAMNHGFAVQFPADEFFYYFSVDSFRKDLTFVPRLNHEAFV